MNVITSVSPSNQQFISTKSLKSINESNKCYESTKSNQSN